LPCHPPPRAINGIPSQSCHLEKLVGARKNYGAIGSKTTLCITELEIEGPVAPHQFLHPPINITKILKYHSLLNQSLISKNVKVISCPLIMSLIWVKLKNFLLKVG